MSELQDDLLFVIGSPRCGSTLLELRRNIHHTAFGRLVKKVRFACDVLLR